MPFQQMLTKGPVLRLVLENLILSLTLIQSSLRPTLAQKFPLPRQEKESLQISNGGASELFSGTNEEKFIISPLVRYGIVL